MVPSAPMGHDVGIGDKYAWCIPMGAENANWFTGLDQQGFVVFQRAEAGHDLVIGFPVTRRPANATIHHEFFWPLGNAWVEVVHEHAQRGFGEPGFCREFGSGGSADDAGIVAAGVHRGFPWALVL